METYMCTIYVCCVRLLICSARNPGYTFLESGRRAAGSMKVQTRGRERIDRELARRAAPPADGLRGLDHGD